MTDKPLSETLAELEAALEKATPGPWFHRQAGIVTPGGEQDWIGDAKEPLPHKKIIIGKQVIYGGSSDYALIVAAINALPRLIAAAREGDELHQARDDRDAHQRLAIQAALERDAALARAETLEKERDDALHDLSRQKESADRWYKHAEKAQALQNQAEAARDEAQGRVAALEAENKQLLDVLEPIEKYRSRLNIAMEINRASHLKKGKSHD